jgi:TolB protein
MIRRFAIGAVLLGVLAAAGSARAEIPSGPRLAIVRLTGLPLRYQLVTVGPNGGDTRVVAGGSRKVRPAPDPYSAASWSMDGGLIAFSGVVGPLRDVRPSQRRIFVAAADGGGLREVPHTEGAFEPILSPDGTAIAFMRERRRYRANDRGGEDLVYESATAWLIGADGSNPRRLTAWRNHLGNTPSTFAPDGRSLVMSRQRGDDRREAVSMPLSDGAPTVLVRDGFGVTYSPDGTRIAFLRGRVRSFETHDGTTVALMSDLFTQEVGGGPVRRLSKTPTMIETAASWDPSGQRLAYTRVGVLDESSIIGFGDSIVEVNADGTCRTTIASDPNAVLFGSAWQPGAGREAGAIAC